MQRQIGTITGLYKASCEDRNRLNKINSELEEKNSSQAEVIKRLCKAAINDKIESSTIDYKIENEKIEYRFIFGADCDKCDANRIIRSLNEKIKSQINLTMELSKKLAHEKEMSEAKDDIISNLKNDEETILERNKIMESMLNNVYEFIEHYIMILG
jgi:hypothetical protein